ncbi:SOH1-domain-containing protein [Clavulina sp. PMI_390]|nr:SOH1-domain-containing protein [Clavulina sp. PMI_390]
MDQTFEAEADSGVPNPRAANRHRFELELEFVQSLANPHYLHALAQEGVMEDPAFVNYLDYLKYWSKPEYARFIIYPHALHHLQLLQNPKFRTDLKSDEVRNLLANKQFEHWVTWQVFF